MHISHLYLAKGDTQPVRLTCYPGPARVNPGQHLCLPCQPAKTTCRNIVLHSLQTQFVQTSFMQLCRNEWPKHKRQVHEMLRPYWSVRGALTLNDYLPVAITLSFHKVFKSRPCRRCTVHIRGSLSAHCESLPQSGGQLEDLIHKCPECSKAAQVPHQPLISIPLPQHPWEKVASDLFKMVGNTYLLKVDYISGYAEVQTVSTTTSASVIKTLKANFSCHGIPATLVSYNEP